MPRMRTAAKAHELILQEDPETEITPNNTEVFDPVTQTVCPECINVPPAAVIALEITLNECIKEII